MFAAIRIDVLDPATLAVFVALTVLSVIAVAVAVFKTIQFSRLGVGSGGSADRVLDAWLAGRSEEALQLVADRRSVLARILQAVFSGLRARPGQPDFAEELGRQTALIELDAMSRRMRLLEIVVQAAPMLGLLGTVIGMIDAFSVLAMSDGAVDPAQLAGGIWVALTTTALGLAVALVAFFLASWFESRIDRERAMIEAAISVAIHGRVDTSATPV
ncbi:MotA/TolQ/ExbB proton channel [Roseivivax marinus]|jgi:biopolymer transport protein ExbB|uniref:MotA/TolQ/ExbB proton channel n=1 Tax=Roseivivax marinus TaxID=1379903 RepID=W4HJP9_9RHOB|nr:MotA/TolQ/ExbB proton channel family protein [Roseivivax marinus]ETW12934.1 MotA/TolQ/ExbB proton channel [Roseivivax marinus]UMA64508.1 MotA/TolQ/ExbB proton channel family protein [Roseivivax marinus]SEL54722.1 biopolymer transport protein ExbB [Roseivivax marinus]